ncbi:hypothetical protein AXF42_Ash002575 [Apostasia shenzhenica]|uniref:Uncharacterized protein n=1 Tax=Apostasia shenzhenica TaxID=1088818 RepID=A0A2I0ANY3_9ASPA|nr:hypothetical protein AXF42_Ash002575 [Apostasia shenzhenica]
MYAVLPLPRVAAALAPLPPVAAAQEPLSPVPVSQNFKGCLRISLTWLLASQPNRP